MIRLGDILKTLAPVTAADQEEVAPLAIPDVALPADRHPARVYLARLGPGSRPTMKGALAEVAHLLSGGRLDADRFPWTRVRYQHTAALRAVLMERYAPATANKILAAVRGVLREGWQLGLITSDDFTRAVAVRDVAGDRLPRGRSLEAGELALLFRSCADDTGARGRRDAAVLALLYGCGLRRAEVVALDAEDYRPDSRELRVRGKGNRDRVTYAGPGTVDALADWSAARGPDAGALVCPVKGGRVTVRRMSPWSLYELVLRRADRAGVAAFTPHDCRRTYVSELLDAGADLSVIRALVGHRSIETTARYDRRGEAAKLRATALLPVPYVRPRGHRTAQAGFGEGSEGLTTPPVGQTESGANGGPEDGSNDHRGDE